MRYDPRSRANGPTPVSQFIRHPLYTGARGFGSLPMARSFLTASSQFASNSSLVLSYPFSVAIWIYSTDLTNAGSYWAASNSGGTTNYWIGSGDGSGHAALATRNPNQTTATTSNVYTANTWNLVVTRCRNATDRDIVLNNNFSAKGTDSSSATPTPNRFDVGALVRSSSPSGEGFFAGSLGRLGVWNVGLSDTEMGPLFSMIEINGVMGYPPMNFVRPDKLIANVPFFGNASPELDQSGSGYNFTLNNSPAQSTTAPPIIYPPSMVWNASS